MGSFASKQNESQRELSSNSRTAPVQSQAGKEHSILYLQRIIGNQAIQQLLMSNIEVQKNQNTVPSTIQRRENPGKPVLPEGVTDREPDDPLPDTGRPSPDNRTKKEIYVLDFGVNRNLMNWREVVMHVDEIEAQSVDQMVSDVKTQVGDPSKNCIQKLVLDGHGSPGNMSVGDGTGWVEGSNISTGNYRKSVRELTPYFCDGATVVLLGCNVGRGSIGARFIQNLAMIWQVKVAAATGVVRGYGIEGIWVWGDPGKQLPSSSILITDQIIRILDETTLGDDEEMIFDLLEEAKGYDLLQEVRMELIRQGRWESLKVDLIDEDSDRFNNLFSNKP